MALLPRAAQVEAWRQEFESHRAAGRWIDAAKLAGLVAGALDDLQDPEAETWWGLRRECLAEATEGL